MIECPACRTPNEDNYNLCRSCNGRTNPRALQSSEGTNPATVQDPKQKAEMLKNKGNDAFTQKDFPKAVQYYMEALRNNPAHDGAWNNMGLSYRSMNDLKSAIRCFSKAIEINPNNASALASKEACEYEINKIALGLVKKEEKKPAQMTHTVIEEKKIISEPIVTKREMPQQIREASQTTGPGTHVDHEPIAYPAQQQRTEERRSPEIRPPAAEPAVVRTNVPAEQPSSRRMEPENIPPPPVTEEKRTAEPVPEDRNKTRENYVVERRMGPLGLRATNVIKTAIEKEYAEEYQRQNRRRSPSPDYLNPYGRNPSTHDTDADIPAPPPDFNGPANEMRGMARNKTKEKNECHYCRNVIDSENRSIRCIECGDFFCATCELDFRGSRKKGEKPLCAKCYLSDIKEKERERIYAERERKRLEKMEEQRRLREKLEDERRMREKLEENGRRMKEKLNEETREKERFREEKELLARLDEEKRMRLKLEKEFMAGSESEEIGRKKEWLSHALMKDPGRTEERKMAEGPHEGSGEVGGRLLTTGNLRIHINDDEDVFDVLARKFEDDEINSEEYELLIEKALESE